jgi:hypothetical protein
MNIIKRIRLEICWKRGHRLYLGDNPACATCQDRKVAKNKVNKKREA